ncbi:MAG TPA: S8 family serine peptidase [Solirubrobacteraceae bacterium]|jgi:serine protease|nr:S8 family serine peptidase [Solirubrobacteraceae bacterium]
MAFVALLLSVAVTCTLTRLLARRDDMTAASPPVYAPHMLVVGYSGSQSSMLAELRQRAKVAVSVSPQPSLTPRESLLRLPANASVTATAARVRALPGITYAVPDYIAHIAGSWYPNDTGRSGKAKGWESLQWNFLAKNGVNAPKAWANLLADHRPGAKGVVIAVVDTGIAFRDWKTFKRSPDFAGTKFVDPCDLIAGTVHDGRCTDPDALDRESHGTFVASTIAEATNNHYGLTGLAYGATIMPVRVLDAEGNGDSSTIAAGIRYAVENGAQVINLSIEFSPGTTNGQIPDVVSAITYAHDHGVVVVGAAGNDEDSSLDYPAALPDVISVGATTVDRCLAVYSDIGKGLNLVAPGGGDDAASVPGSSCHPTRNLPDIYQMTFNDPTRPSVFSLPGGWFGTSMAAPAVSAAAAMVIASGVIGQHPSPTAILNRLEATARPLGTSRPNNEYGWGLLDVGAATGKGGPLTPPSSPYALPGAGNGGVVR